MPSRPREPAPPPGLFASAFSFVSREIESFVAAATGGDVEKVRPSVSFVSLVRSWFFGACWESRSDADSAQAQRRAQREERARRREMVQPEASSSRVTLDSRRREREEGRGKRARKRSEVGPERARTKRRLREEGEGEHSAKVSRKKQVREERERSSEREAADDEDGESAHCCMSRPAELCLCTIL